MSPANRFLVRFLALPAAIFLAVAVAYSFAQYKSLRRADSYQLTGNWEQWAKAGMPAGNDLSEFVSRRSVLINTQVLELEGGKCQSLFELRDPRTDHDLRITTNGIVVRLKPDGTAEKFR